MTDKEIIIDGIDIRKCKHFKALYESRPDGFGGITIENYCYLYEDNCEKYPQCLYRSNQLQQLDQLKEENKKLEKQVGIFTRQLEKANKEVIKEKEKNAAQRQENEKLKQTLADIEFWVREFLKRTSQVVPNEIRQILQKISEVEVDNAK